jgi:hypothetical protein
MSFLDVILAVLKNKYVIIAFVAVILYLSFINYIISYRKRPKRVKQKKVIESAPAPKKESQEASSTESEVEDDDEYVE